MDANEYQKLAARTLIDKPDFEITDSQIMIAWNAIGLAGEAGEAADYFKKHCFHNQPLDIENCKREIGDVLWYAAALCTKLGITMEEVMAHNIEKLKARYPNGYNQKDSTNRDGMAA